MCRANPDCDEEPLAYHSREPCVVVLSCCGTRVPTDDGTIEPPADATTDGDANASDDDATEPDRGDCDDAAGPNRRDSGGGEGTG